MGEAVPDLIDFREVCIPGEHALPVLVGPALGAEGEDILEVLARVDPLGLRSLYEREEEAGGVGTVHALAEKPVLPSRGELLCDPFHTVVRRARLEAVEVDVKIPLVLDDVGNGLAHLGTFGVAGGVLRHGYDAVYDGFGERLALVEELLGSDCTGLVSTPPLESHLTELD